MPLTETILFELSMRYILCLIFKKVYIILYEIKLGHNFCHFVCSFKLYIFNMNVFVHGRSWWMTMYFVLTSNYINAYMISFMAFLCDTHKLID